MKLKKLLNRILCLTLAALMTVTSIDAPVLASEITVKEIDNLEEVIDQSNIDQETQEISEIAIDDLKAESEIAKDEDLVISEEISEETLESAAVTYKAVQDEDDSESMLSKIDDELGNVSSDEPKGTGYHEL